ncbi:MAG: universal stress protein [Magnetococcales bacterium]|nr:universal stress protein [Magnetococcales bacterium]MBF0260892.1 universal stress protein [Magnetococcales bacterium]
MNDTDVAMTDPCKVVLLATDGSEFSAGVESVGLELAQHSQSHLHLLRLLLAEPGTDASIVEEQDANLKLDQIANQCLASGIEHTRMIRPAEDPTTGILTAAQEIDAQLVIVGRRGRRGLAKNNVGEATTKLLDKLECSILVVPRLFSFWSSGVLLVIDPDETAGDQAALVAIRLAHGANIPLTILLVVDEKDEACRDANLIVNRLVAMAQLHGVSAEGLVHGGDLDEVVLEVARQRSDDLIVCEPRDRSMFDRLFNINDLVKLIGKANCPVLVVKGAPKTDQA